MKLKSVILFVCIIVQGLNSCSGQTNKLPDTAHYKVDTFINRVNINNNYFCVDFFRNNNDSIQVGNDSNELIFVVREIKTGKVVYVKGFKENRYTIFKPATNSLDKKGRLFLEVEFDGGGSGFSGECYEVISSGNNIEIHPVYSLDELSLLYFNGDNEIIKLEGDWNYEEGESHFSDHRYLIFKYDYINKQFVQTRLGKTKYKYPSLDENESTKQVLFRIKKKEPVLLKSITLK